MTKVNQGLIEDHLCGSGMTAELPLKEPVHTAVAAHECGYLECIINISVHLLDLL